METILETDKCLLYCGDCAEGVPLPDATLDSLVTDPPCGLAMHGHAWDSDKGGRDKWIAWLAGALKEALRLLKPGAHGLVWALPKQTHWTGMAIEDAGFEIVHVVHHLYAEGFPKGQDIGAKIDKALGLERPVIGVKNNTYDGCVRDPSKHSSPAADASPGMAWGLNKTPHGLPQTGPASEEAKRWDGWNTCLKPAVEHWYLVRKPLAAKNVAANVLQHGVGGINVDACRVPPGRYPADLITDGNVEFKNSSFFYAAKPGKSERNEGCSTANPHATVKCLALMDYLVKLITPKDGIVLDLFAGSGSTGVSAVRNGFGFVGVELNTSYALTAKERLAYAERIQAASV